MRRMEAHAKAPALPEEKRTNYRTIPLTRKEAALAALEGIGLIAVLDLLFYSHPAGLLVLWPLLIIWMKEAARRKRERIRRQLRSDFRVALHSLAVSFRAGYSAEHAFSACGRDVRNTLGRESELVREMDALNRRIRLQLRPEEVFAEFAFRTGVEDVEAFAEVFSAARRSGGDLAAIVRSAADTIGAKIEVTEEIEASLAARKSEQQIMSLMPCLILLYLRIASPGFLDVLYGNVAGACVMTCALAVYLLCIRAGNRIVEVGI